MPPKNAMAVAHETRILVEQTREQLRQLRAEQHSTAEVIEKARQRMSASIHALNRLTMALQDHYPDLS